MTSAMHPYYAAKLDRLMADFRAAVDHAAPVIERIVGAGAMAEATRRFEDAYRVVVAELPYVGGDDGRMTPFFERGLSLLAIGRVLRADGVEQGRIGRAMMAVFKGYLAPLPEAERQALGRQFMSPENLRYLEEQAAWSRTKEHPEDFVYSIVHPDDPEDGGDFDFGVDYHECGLCKFCRSHGDDDLLPHICAVDFESYGLRGIHLERTTTLASGAERCNFRFKLPEQ